MDANNLTGKNIALPIYNQDGTSFNGLVLKKSVYQSVVMSLGDKITGDVYYPNNSLVVTMSEYVEYKGERFVLVNPPTIVREGMVSDNGELKGMTKYSFTFYHPMYMLGNFPFCDVAVSIDQQRYLSENKTFAWIGNLVDYVAKINKNLESTEWYCVISDNVQTSERNKLSEVEAFDKETIAEALKRGYEIWEVPYIISTIASTDPLYQQGKRYLIQYGLPTTEILVENEQHELVPFVFHFGKGVGLKNNSRTPRNNKIVTRIAGYGSEDNIPYGYPQIPYEGGTCQYPLYYGIVGGQRVQLIKHPFTRTHLMPPIYRETVNKKVNPMAVGYDPTIEIKDYYDADSTYENPIKPEEPSYEIHEFEKIKPEFGNNSILGVVPVSNDVVEQKYTTMQSFLTKLRHYIQQTNIDIERHVLNDVYNKVQLHADAELSQTDEKQYYFHYKIEVSGDYEKVIYESSNINFEETILLAATPPAPDWDDEMDDDGNYNQSYFKITIPQLSFDVYASAAVTQEMTVNMRSGACLGCSFPVMVDWDDYKINFYDKDGNFAPNGEQRDLEKYPNSQSGQIELTLQKETNTFGTLMPNIYQKPASGDKFVFLGISMPTSYITEAESRLETDMKQYMRDNNVHYFDYPLKFDEKFLVDHIGILNQMQNNVVVRFDYAGEVHALFIKQISIKYENKPLPTYDITLADDIEIVLNQIGQVTDEVSKLRLALNGGGGGSASGDYIRKDIDDTGYGLIRLIKGMQVGERFVTGLLGEGGVFRKEADGTTYLECDKLYVRMRAYFDTVEIRKYIHSGGNRIASLAGIKCSRVEYIDANGNVTNDASNAAKFRCFFRANNDGQEVTNDFVVGDLAFCKETNSSEAQGVEQHGYWRAVVGRNAQGVLTGDGEGWIDLSATDCLSGSDVPIAQDDIVQLGNKTDTTRQGAIIEFVSGADAPSYQIYQGINNYSLNGKNYIGLGYSSQNARAYLNVYGDAYIGDPEENTYIKYNAGTRNLEIKAKISAQSTIDGETLAQFIAENTWTEEQIDALITAETDPLSDAIDEIKRQVDGSIATWFYDGVPTLQNLPASEWTTADDKNEHLGDLYYDNLTGYAYRFKYDDTNRQWSWMRITDVDVTKALADAAKAQDTADHKRRVFVVQPTPPYDAGDLWVNATYPSGNTETNEAQNKYYNDVLRCKTSKASGTTFAISDWSLASKYTDDSALYTFINGDYATFVTDITNQVDGKAETWYQSTDPAASWSTQELKLAHKGDIWHNTASSTVSGVEAGRDAIWSGTEWEMSDVPQEVYDKIDGKADIFVSKPTTYNKFDMWIIESSESTCPDADIPSGCKRGDIVIAKNKRTNSYTKADWQKKDRYTDDSALNTFKANQYVTQLTNGTITTNIANAQSAASAAQQAADNAQADADAAATAAANAQTSATNANNRLDGWADDGKISPTEKTSLKLEWENVKKEYAQICNDADKYSVSKTAFASAYTSANSAFQKYTAATPENITIGTDYANIAAYYAARQTILDAITTAAKKVATDAQAKADSAYALAGSAEAAAQAAEAHAATLDYVKTALKQDTVIDGGLVISTLLALRDGNNKIWSGINGAYKSAETGTGYKGHGIAAWYGGAMVDKEVTTMATDYAKSLFRFDGSGYVASGNLSWDKNGNVTIQGYSINATTLQVGGSAVATQAALADYVTLATDQTISGHKTFGTGNGSYIQIGAIRIVYDSSNNALKIVASNGSGSANLYATGGISALGQGNSGDSGVSMATVWTALANNTSEQINASHLSTALSSYATQSWVISQIPSVVDAYTKTESDGRFMRISGYTNFGATSENPVDLNNVVTYGVYRHTGSSNQNYITNKPDGCTGVFRLIVERSAYNTNPYIRQIYQEYDKPIVYERHSVNTGSTWSAWVKVQDNIANYVTSSQLSDYLPLTGGTMSNTNLVTNLNADLLDGQHGSYYATASSVTTISGYFSNGVASMAAADSNGRSLVTYKEYSDTFPPNDGTLQWYTLLTYTNNYYSKSAIVEISTRRATAIILINFFNTNSPYITFLGYYGNTASGGGGFTGGVRVIADENNAKIQFQFYASTSSSTYRVLGVKVYSVRPENWVLVDSLVADTATYESFLANVSATSGCFSGGGLMPTANNTYNIGSSSFVYKNVYATAFNGATFTASGNVTVGGTLNATGLLKVATGIGIDDASGNGLLVYHPTSYTGVTSSQWCVGTPTCQGVIRTDANPIIHYRGGTSYEVIDSSGGQSIANSLQVASVKIEETNEINSYSGMLHLNYRKSTNLSLGYGGGNVGVGTVNPSYRLHVEGVIYSDTGVYSSGYITALSDIRHKDVKGDVNLTVSDVANAPSVKFLWKDRRQEGLQVGSIAQYWQKVIPEAVVKNADGELTMSYGVIALLASIATARKVEDHERRIAELERENKLLKEQLNAA